MVGGDRLTSSPLLIFFSQNRGLILIYREFWVILNREERYIMIDLETHVDDYRGSQVLTEKGKNDDGGEKPDIKAIATDASEKIVNLENNLKKHTVNSRSIVAKASKSVMQFPVYVTQSIKAPEAHTIGKMFERVYASFVQTAFSQRQIISEDEANDLKFLTGYHTNIKDKAVGAKSIVSRVLNEYYQPIDEIDEIMMESLHHIEDLGDGCYLEFSIIPVSEEIHLESMRLANEPLTGFHYLQEDSKIKSGLKKGLDKAFAPSSEKSNKKPDSETVTTSEKRNINAQGSATEEQINRAAMKMKVDDYLKDQPAEKQHEAQKKELKKELEAGRTIDLGKDGHLFMKDGKYMIATTLEKSTSTSSVSRNEPRQARPVAEILRDTDIKKINGMLPYTIKVTFKVKGSDDISFELGVKTVMHLININDLRDDLADIMTGSQKNLQKIRYKTGEITASQRFLNIKGLKADAAKNLTSKKWLNTLKRLGEYEKLNGTLLKKGVESISGGEVPIPNGTLVLTQDNIDMMKHDTGIDLGSASQAKALSKRLFLIGVVIIDQIAGSMKVLFPDSDNDWDIQSIAAIDAETAKQDNSHLLNELNKITRK